MATHTTVPPPSAVTYSLLPQAGGALLGIIALIVAGAWLMKRLGFSGKASASGELRVSASAALGPRERVVIVNVEDARLVLGVTASQISLLHTLPPASAEKSSAPEGDFPSMIKKLLTRYGRS